LGLLPKVPLAPYLLRNRPKESPRPERNPRQLRARVALLDGLEYGVARRLGEHIADAIRTAALARPESRDWSPVMRLIDFATLTVFEMADAGIGKFDPAPLEKGGSKWLKCNLIPRTSHR
jgi:hypothetical protein